MGHVFMPRIFDASIPTIEFTYQSTAYIADSGMTWGEWVESDYNTAGIYIDSSDGCVISSEDTPVVLSTATGKYIYSTEKIVAGATYKNDGW